MDLKLEKDILNNWSPEEKSDLIHSYVMRYADRNIKKVDYGTGELYNSVEMHVLEKICLNEGITVTELAHLTYRTKGAVSQIVKKLDEKKLIDKVYPTTGMRQCCLYPTESGKILDQMHRDYDARRTTEFFATVAEYCTKEQINDFFQVMATCLALLSPDENYPWTKI